MIASYPAEKYGRRFTLLWNNVFFLIGTALCASGNLSCLFIGRLISGFGVGIVSVLAPILLAEMASPENRGTITIMHQVSLTLAILVAALVGYGLVTYVNHGWQYTVGLTCVPSLIMLAGAHLVPESPKWLVAQGRQGDAVSIIRRLRPLGYDAEAEATEILSDCKGETRASDVTWSEVFACKKAVVVGCGLMFFQALTGINSVTFYSTTIFSFAGFDQAILATASFGAVNFVTTLVAAYLVDNLGRKVLLSWGTYIMFGALVSLSTVLVAANDNPALQGPVAVASVLVFVVGFAIGLGAVCWVIMSEV